MKRLTGFLGELAGSPTGEFAGVTRFRGGWLQQAELFRPRGARGERFPRPPAAPTLHTDLQPVDREAASCALFVGDADAAVAFHAAGVTHMPMPAAAAEPNRFPGCEAKCGQVHAS